MIEADAPSTGHFSCPLHAVCSPHRDSHGITRGPAQRFKDAKLRAAPDRSKGAARGIIEAGTPAAPALKWRWAG
jgi:hypothetical protein